MTHHGRTLASLVALGLAAVGTAAPAVAATTTPKPKPVSLKAAQYPRLIDNPGKGNDAIRITYVQGLNWQIDGKSVTGFEGRTFKDEKVTAGSQVTVQAADGDVVPWELAVGTPRAWEFPAPKTEEAPAIDASSAVAVWNDLPGDKKDSVTLTNVEGVTWTVTTGEVVRTVDTDAFRGKSTLVLPATPDTVVTPAPAAGYEFDPNTSPGVGANTITTTPEIVLTAEFLDATIETGENPLDATKGYGPGAAVETVKVTGIPGVKYAVGTRKAVAVNGVAYLPVDPDDLEAGNGTVEVKVASGKGYSVPADYVKKVTFIDGEKAPAAVVSNDDIQLADRGGITNDTLTIKPSQGMTWWVGQADKTGKIKYVAQKPGKGGVITYKAKHASRPTDTTEKATVHVKAVANRGWTVDATNLTTKTYEFTRDSTTIPADNAAAGNSEVTLKPYEGVGSWTVKYTSTVGTKTTSKVLTVKPLDVANTGASSMTIAFPEGTEVTAATKTLKDYVVAE